MIIIYFDLFTTCFFFLLICYVVSSGINKKQETANHFIHKLNLLVYQNHWLYVLPYFYAITLLTDLENFFVIKTQAVQIIYFFSLIAIQILIFLKNQPLSILSYGITIKKSLQKFHLKFVKLTPKNANQEQIELFLKNKEAAVIHFMDIFFVLNSFILPLIFVITNSFFITKSIFFLLNLKP